VDVVATDHAPHAPGEKAVGDHDIWAAPGGLPGLETLLSAMLEVCGQERLETLVRCCCERPAERFGLGHRKGRVRPGHDADLVLVDPRATWRVEPRALHTRAGSSPFAGRSFRGRAECTIVGGEIVAERGAVVGEPRGAWVKPLRSGPR
jgi:dihydroorotase